jgi:hypothetical protein
MEERNMLSQLLMHSKMFSLTLKLELANGGLSNSMEETNGSGKSEFSIEETAVVEDLVVPLLQLEDKNVDRSKEVLRTVNGTMSNVPNLLEVVKLNLQLLKKPTYQFKESKFTLPNALEMAAMA